MQLADVLRTWSADQLAHLLRARPDLADPPPADLPDLARRASTYASVRTAVRDLPTPSRLVLEGLAVVGDASVELLVQLSEPAPPPALVEEAIEDLRARLLLGPDTLTVTRDVGELLPAPARLGTSLELLLPAFGAHSLHRLAAALGLPPSRSKTLAVQTVLSAFATADGGHATVERLPAHMRDRLRALDEQGPVVAVRGLDPARGAYPEDPGLIDLLAAGIVVHCGGSYVEIPSEVAVGLRHPHPLRLAVPLPAGPQTPHDPGSVGASAAAAAHGALAAFDVLADELDRAPLSLLGTGGVGVRELRRVAERAGVAAADVATLLEVGESLGLVKLMSKDLRLTRRWDPWRKLAEAERWSELARAWTRLAVLPAARSGRQQPALRSWGDPELGNLRPRLLEVLRAAPRDVAVPPATWAARYAARWYPEPQLPYGPVRRSVEEQLLADLFAEATLLGLAVDGAPSPLRGLAPDDLTSLADVGAQRVRAQADGTLVCTGTPSLRLRTDLDLLAAVESRGAATVWRLTEGSLSRAYGAGWTAAEALAALERWAGELPQAMRYLVQDAERRAGRLRTGAASSYVVAEDEAALADALAVLRGLKLTRIAPTVAVSAATPEALADALDRAGLAATGVRAGARPTGKRAAADRVPPLPAPPRDEELSALAQRLAR